MAGRGSDSANSGGGGCYPHRGHERRHLHLPPCPSPTRKRGRHGEEGTSTKSKTTNTARAKADAPRPYRNIRERRRRRLLRRAPTQQSGLPQRARGARRPAKKARGRGRTAARGTRGGGVRKRGSRGGVCGQGGVCVSRRHAPTASHWSHPRGQATAGRHAPTAVEPPPPQRPLNRRPQMTHCAGGRRLSLLGRPLCVPIEEQGQCRHCVGVVWGASRQRGSTPPPPASVEAGVPNAAGGSGRQEPTASRGGPPPPTRHARAAPALAQSERRKQWCRGPAFAGGRRAEAVGDHVGQDGVCRPAAGQGG